jgi:hypothetical protein
MSKTADRLEFAAPGPGGWMRLADHFPGALTAEYQRIYTETAPVGMACWPRGSTSASCTATST